MQASPSQGMLARINPDTTGQAGFSSQQELTIMLTRKADAAPKVVDFPLCCKAYHEGHAKNLNM